MNKEPNWTLEDVDSEDEMEIDDNTSLKLSSLTSSSPRTTTSSPRTTTSSPKTNEQLPLDPDNVFKIDISNIEPTPTNKIDTTVKNDDKHNEQELFPHIFHVTSEDERMRRRIIREEEQKRIEEYVSNRPEIDKSEYLSNKIEDILKNENKIDAVEYVNVLKKLIDKRRYEIRPDLLEQMKEFNRDNKNYQVIEEILNYYNSNKIGGKRYTRKTKKPNKKTKKFPGKIRKHKKSRKSRKSKKFPGKIQNAIKKKR